MAERNAVIGHDFSVVRATEFKWTLPKFSEILYNEYVFSPHFCLAFNCNCLLSLRKYEDYLYVYICNKSDASVEIERIISMYDCNNRILYQQSRDGILVLEKDEDVSLHSLVPRHPYDTLPNDTLIIDLCIYIKGISETNMCYIRPDMKLKEDLKTMLENPVNSDISLQVGDEQIPAHWSILCSRSPYFKRMFECGMQERVQNVITITDLSLGTVRKLIQFLYTAELDQVDNLVDLFDLYCAADKYQLLNLRNLCACKIKNYVAVDNVVQILLFAHHHNNERLLMEATDFIHSNSEAVFQTEEWVQLKARDPLATAICSFLCKKKKSNLPLEGF